MTTEPGSKETAIVEIVSLISFEAALDRLAAVIAEAGMTVFARIDHAAAAETVGLAMPPTVVLIYGNPRGGTPLMLATPLAALDLPLRVLVRVDQDGHTRLAFHPITDVLRRVGVPDAAAARLAQAQELLMSAVRSP